MILEFDTSIFKITKDYNGYSLNINQAVYLTLKMNKNQNKNQSIHKLLDLMSDTEIKELIDHSLLTEDKELVKEYKEKLEPCSDFFQQFYNTYPDVVTRSDGTRGFLKANVNKCRKEYNKIVGKSLAMHEHIMDCLKFEMDKKLTTGRTAYFKNLWNWLVQHEWEAIENEMEYERKESNEISYGNSVVLYSTDLITWTRLCT